MRINKYLAACGVASRRNSEMLVTSGRVRLNGRVVTSLATDIGSKDIVTLDGTKVAPISKHIYLMLNKPKGYVCTSSDEHGRKTVFELTKDQYASARLFSVGRLDYDTEGLLILTTDGDLANDLMHPSREVTKTYVAKIEGAMEETDLDRLRQGVVLDGVKTKKCKVRLLAFEDNVSRVEVVIQEGRNRQVRRMFDSINKTVVYLKRTAIGNLRLGGLSRGKYKVLDNELLKRL